MEFKVFECSHELFPLRPTNIKKRGYFRTSCLHKALQIDSNLLPEYVKMISVNLNEYLDHRLLHGGS